MRNKNNQLLYRRMSNGEGTQWSYAAGLDDMSSPGFYILQFRHCNAGLGLPLPVCGEDHYIMATLIVTESGTDDKLQRNRLIGQTLILPLCNDGKTHIYTRTLKCVNNSWQPWVTVQQNIYVGQVASFDANTDSGIYSGVYINGSSNETFSMVVIDNKATAEASGNVRSVSQFKYSLNVDGTFSCKTRTGQGDTSITWGEWMDIGAADTTDIQDNSITAQKLSTDVRKMLENVTNMKNAIQIDSPQITSDVEKVSFCCSSIEGNKTITVNIPSATTTHAGVMSADDKKSIIQIIDTYPRDEKDSEYNALDYGEGIYWAEISELTKDGRYIISVPEHELQSIKLATALQASTVVQEVNNNKDFFVETAGITYIRVQYAAVRDERPTVVVKEINIYPVKDQFVTQVDAVATDNEVKLILKRECGNLESSALPIATASNAGVMGIEQTKLIESLVRKDVLTNTYSPAYIEECTYWFNISTASLAIGNKCVISAPQDDLETLKLATAVNINAVVQEINNNEEFIVSADGIKYIRARYNSVRAENPQVTVTVIKEYQVIEELKNAVSSPLKGKKISVIGDSVSTIKDGNTPYLTIKSIDIGKEIESYITWWDVYTDSDGTSLKNKTIGSVSITPEMIGTLQKFTPVSEDVGKTLGEAMNYNATTTNVWSQTLCKSTGAELIANASWSGSRICQRKTEGMYALSYAWSDYTIGRCRIRDENGDNVVPDIIIIFRGINDFSHSPIVFLDGAADLMQEFPSTDFIDDEAKVNYINGYMLTIQKLRNAYPMAKIICCTLPVFKRGTYDRFPVRNGVMTLPQMNDAIRSIANIMGCGIIEFDKCGITLENNSDYTFDGTHPNNEGHNLLAAQAERNL